MKILLLTQFYDPEPAALQSQLARFLNARGHQVRVITGFPNYPGGAVYPGYKVRVTQRETIDGVEVIRLPLYPSHDRSPIRRTTNYLSFGLAARLLGSRFARGFDVAYVYHPPGTVPYVASIWARSLELPYVIHLQDMWPESVTQSSLIGSPRLTRLVERALSRMCQRAYGRAAGIVAISPGFKRLLAERGVPPDKVRVVPNWADEQLLESARRAEIPEDFPKATVMFAGNIGHFQGLEVALRAANSVRDLEGFRLVIMGAGQALEDLTDLARELALPNVVFIGRQSPERAAVLARTAKMQLVSLEDRPFFAATVPGKTQACLAGGHPVIMAVRGDAADIVREAEAGIVCEPGSVGAMARAFREAFELSAEQAEELGRNGRAFYEERLAFARAAERFERALRDAAACA